jgi:hypothetical protein
MKKKLLLPSLLSVIVGAALFAAPAMAKVQTEQCDVIVAGGSTAALSAALHSAREGAQTCLIEPTDWAGGQLTAGGVPAVDFPWREDVQGVNTKAAMKDPRNNNYEFIRWLLDIGSTGDCIVSRHCFLPQEILNEKINPAISNEPNLRVFYQAVVKSVDTTKEGSQRLITGVHAIKRTAKGDFSFNGYDKRLSQDLSDWYDAKPSARFDKKEIKFVGRDGKLPVVIEATELGDVLALSKAKYLIAADVAEGSTEQRNSRFGQSITLTFNMAYHDKPVTENAPEKRSVLPDSSAFNWGTYGWDNLWIYRRLLGSGAPGPEDQSLPEISLMNWKQGNTNNGNDYADKYLFLNYDETKKQVESGDWRGGIDTAALDGAERLSYSFYYWFKEHHPGGKGDHMNLALETTGTAHGFYKFPYMRESRRSVGYQDFILKTSDLDAYVGKTGKPFVDRVAITAYDYDIHPMNGYTIADYGFDPEKKDINPKPFFIPFRALTNTTYNNLLVAGKNMAQSFKVSSAIRLHPGEYTSGTAAGVTAGYMVQNNMIDTHKMVDHKVYEQLQPIIRKYQPLEWIIEDQVYPASEVAK